MASNAGGVGRNRDSGPISGFTASCEAFQRQVHTSCCDRSRPVYNTIVASERPSLLTVANNGEVYDKKPQRYAEDNVMQW